MAETNYILLKDKVLLYIDEQVCSRLTGSAKKHCKEMIDTNGKDLMTNIRNGMVRKKTSKEISLDFINCFQYLASNASLYTFPVLC